MNLLTRVIIRVLLVAVSFFFVLPSASVEAARKTKKSSYSKATKKYRKNARKAKRYRRTACNTQQGKEQALQLIQSNQTLAEFSGIEYKPNALSEEVRRQLLDDGETLTDEDYESEGMDDVDLALADDSTPVSAVVLEDLWMQYVEREEGEDWLTDAGISKKRIMKEIVSWVGTRYHFGGTSRQGVDCSSFMQHLYENAAALRLPRTAREQYTIGERIGDKKELKFGDLIFFNTRRGVYASHVGVYLGDNLFAHASSRYGVTLSSLESSYYSQRFIGGSRLSSRDLVKFSVNEDLYAQNE